jgi:hypothetical protein
MISTASVRTANGARYLVQLCKHWAHRLTVEYTDTTGKVAFDAERSCSFQANAESLTVRIEAPEAALARTEEVVAEHLQRFARQETLLPINWGHAP